MPKIYSVLAEQFLEGIMTTVQYLPYRRKLHTPCEYSVVVHRVDIVIKGISQG